ncbi:complex I NDUFA9 subunit family protein [Rhodovarius crocodyli]|uniref:Complex I NDUFA9 subunit family protein n=1 Tax=Rhodovarius crocodyli TaxID=1979269 RepID=A0A437MMZ6_9PROT|nr:complex I NDUFA9 subunit family protein [Rhodovarius crocodyli]RVT99024.1 complex I NDUFA9 subunit family protein [Rhodovarius crocodyli]
MTEIITLFGGAGFIGRHVLQKLVRRGLTVRVASRSALSGRSLCVGAEPGQVIPLRVDLRDPAAIAAAVRGSRAVVNFVGILAEARGGDFEALQHQGAGAIARAATEAGVRDMVHLSAIGAAADSPSLYARTKAMGEQAVLAGFPGAVILRPSLVFGAGDGFFNRFAQIARLSPVMPVFYGNTRFQPIWVEDVAEAVVRCLEAPALRGQTLELGGPSIRSFRQLMQDVLRYTGLRRRLLDIPPAIAEWQARIMEHVPGKPLTRDQLVLLQRDNVVTGKDGLSALGITPHPADVIAPGYLRGPR